MAHSVKGKLASTVRRIQPKVLHETDSLQAGRSKTPRRTGRVFRSRSLKRSPILVMLAPLSNLPRSRSPTFFVADRIHEHFTGKTATTFRARSRENRGPPVEKLSAKQRATTCNSWSPRSEFPARLPKRLPVQDFEINLPSYPLAETALAINPQGRSISRIDRQRHRQCAVSRCVCLREVDHQFPQSAPT